MVYWFATIPVVLSEVPNASTQRAVLGSLRQRRTAEKERRNSSRRESGHGSFHNITGVIEKDELAATGLRAAGMIDGDKCDVRVGGATQKVLQLHK